MSQPADDTRRLISRLEAEFDLDDGFLGRLRQGQFDPTGLDRLLRLLQSIDFGEATELNRRVVALLWMIPTLMLWQLERVTERGGDLEALRHGIDNVEAILMSPSVLGAP
jgi:hypothetical protein